MNKRVLLVDDEYDVLSAYKRNLRKDFVIFTAANGADALDILRENDEFALVITDYRMPKMTGIELLAHVQEKYPDTVRIIITGHADLQLAIDAVNKGNIFRFLTKPLPTQDMHAVITDSIELYRLKTSEKELLNKTFKGIINIFMELLQQAHPSAFNQIKRTRQLGRKIAEELGYNYNWEFEISFMLSKLGCVVIPADIVEKLMEGKELDKYEKKIVSPYPEIGYELLSKIPRLENIAKIIKYQNVNFDGSNAIDEDIYRERLPLYSRILKAVNDFDFHLQSGRGVQDAIYTLQESAAHYDPEILNALSYVAVTKKTHNPVISVGYKELKIGMLLVRDIKDEKGNLLIREGTELTDMLLMRVFHAAKVRKIKEPILVIETYKNQ